LRPQWNFPALLLHSSVLMQVIESILRKKPAPIQNHKGVDEQQSGLFIVMVVVVESKQGSAGWKWNQFAVGKDCNIQTNLEYVPQRKPHSLLTFTLSDRSPLVALSWCLVQAGPLRAWGMELPDVRHWCRATTKHNMP
jgi:hypothetical protein